jgi:hypothetical protein
MFYPELASSWKGDVRIGEKCMWIGFCCLHFGVVYPGVRACILISKRFAKCAVKSGVECMLEAKQPSSLSFLNSMATLYYGLEHKTDR